MAQIMANHLDQTASHLWMEKMRTTKKVNALRTIASLFGILAGIGGMMHAPGELLQGNVAPGGMFFNSWTLEPIASNVGGEPALSVIPNLFVTGILTIVISLVEIVWAALFVERRYGGAALILLSITMLVFGGGFAPPLIGIIAGIAGLGIKRKLPAWYQAVFGNRLGVMAKSWPWVFSICAANGMFLVIGSIVFGYILGVRIPNVWVISFLLSIPLLIELHPKNWTQKRRFLVNGRASSLMSKPLVLELNRGQVA